MIVTLKNRGASYMPVEAQKNGMDYVVDIHTMDSLVDILNRNGPGSMIEIIIDKRRKIPMLRVYGGQAPDAQLNLSVPEEFEEQLSFDETDHEESEVEEVEEDD